MGVSKKLLHTLHMDGGVVPGVWEMASIGTSEVLVPQ